VAAPDEVRAFLLQFRA